ncbi:DinB family protein [Luteibaculum oceani]|uniref:DinB family protein n=1 Tax=Luteibaculum oceani TaxID=1294296 RepID=A0A5C6UU07_9FLAO|nr:DinB family protein [Luteibaculum oceani]TXC76114.1 DinB family protein [Luteibaculum oceani]
MSLLDEVLAVAPEYYHRYIRLIGKKDPVVVMEEQSEALDELLGGVAPNEYTTSYAEGKWSIKEVVGHINDVERIFGYRAMAFSRGEEKELPGFEQDDYVANAPFNDVAMEELLEEFYHLRQANLHMFKNLSQSQWNNMGKASGVKIGVQAICYIMAGHVMHHMNVLESKYL